MSRVRINFASGNVANAPLAVGEQTLESADLADLPEVASPDVAVLVLGPLTDAPEIVHVTAHTAGATTATIVRAREGSAEAEWPQGTGWDHTPTARDHEEVPQAADLADDKWMKVSGGAWVPADPPQGAFANDDANTRIIPAETGYGWVVGAAQFDDTGTGSEDERAFFDKADGSFRAGSVTGTQWDAANRGPSSHAEGRDTIASGHYSHAEGLITEATSMRAHAEGYNTEAIAAHTHAEGSGTLASSSGAHAEGEITTASGAQAHSEGYDTTASGHRGHSEGRETAASGLESHAEGNGSTASGQRAHAEGYKTSATYSNAHAEGTDTVASAQGSHAEGSNTSATETAAHAEGVNSRAGGYGSHAEGRSQTTALYTHAEGAFALARRNAQHAQGTVSFNGVADGTAQASRLVEHAETTDATATLLEGYGAGTNWDLEPDRAYNVKIQAVAQRQDAEGEVAGWTWEGVVARDTNGGSRVVGTPVEQAWADTAAGAWVLDVAINADALELTATGEAGKTIRWVATLYVTEVG